MVEKEGLRGTRAVGWNPVLDIHTIQQTLSVYVVLTIVPAQLLPQWVKTDKVPAFME